MKPTEILMNEHRVIEQVLTCLEKMTDQFVAAGAVEAQPARDAVEFFRNFADRCHHGKEEQELFPAMEKRGFSSEFGPTAVMRFEHDDGRAHVRAMDESIDEASRGDTAALKTFAVHARAYVQLLREHIHKEDHCLFPMANQALSDADQNALMDQFDHVEHEEMGAGVHERYLAIANALAERYGVKTQSADSTGQGSCSGHCGSQAA